MMVPMSGRPWTPVSRRQPAMPKAGPRKAVAKAGDPIAYDGDAVVRAPYDECVLVMPVPNNVKTGLTAVRLGRIDRRPRR